MVSKIGIQELSMPGECPQPESSLAWRKEVLWATGQSRMECYGSQRVAVVLQVLGVLQVLDKVPALRMNT